MISPGLPAFLLVLGVRTGKTVWEQINPAGSKQVSLIHFRVVKPGEVLGNMHGMYCYKQ